MDGQKDKEKKIKMELVKVTEEMMMKQDGKRVAEIAIIGYIKLI